MKLLKHLFFISLLVASTGVLHGQDIHWTQFTMSPMTLNPALTGDFEGTARIGGLYRDQYNFVRGKTPGGKGFNTPSFFVDVPIIMVRKNDWLSGGMALYRDQAGAGGLTSTGFLASASYHLALDKKGKSYFVGGIQFGNESIKFTNKAAYCTETDLLGVGCHAERGSTHPDIVNLPEDGINQKVTNLGLMYRTAVDKNTNMNIGTAFSYITRPPGSITSPSRDSSGTTVSGGANASGGPFKRPLKITIHGQMDRKLNNGLTIYPAFIFQNSAKVNTIALQAMGGYQLEYNDKELEAKAGLGYRVGDAVQILLGANYDDWQIGLAYDLTISGLTSANNFRGGFELAVNKIIRIYKEPAVPPVIFCPDL